MRKIFLILLFSVQCARALTSFTGEIYRNSFSGTATSDTLTLATGVAVGQRIVIKVVNEADYTVNAKNISSIADSKSHTGTSRGIVHLSSVHNAEIWDYMVTTALVSGDTITVTWSSAQNTDRGYIIEAVGGTTSSSVVDVSVATTSPFNTTVTTSLSPTIDNDYIGGLVVIQGDKTYTLGNGTQIGAQLLVGFSPGSTVGLLLTSFYRIQTAHTSFSPAGAINVNETAICIMVAYKQLVTRERKIDFAAGADSSDGLTTGTAWKHCPGDTNCTSTAAAFTPTAGDVFTFKGGVVYTGDIAIKQAGSSGLPIIYDGTGATWGTGRAEIDLTYTYYHAFYSNPGKSYITLRGFKIYHAKNNNNAVNVLNNRAESDQLITYGGDGDIYSEAGIFDFGGSFWIFDGLSISDFENAYDRSVLGAESDSDTPNVTPIEIPCTKAGIELYNGAHSCTITNCTLWAIGRTAIKIFGCTNYLVTDCNIGGSDGITNKGWFAVAVKAAGNGGWFANGIIRRVRAHDGWQYQGDEAQQRCHAGDWFHIFGDPNFDHAGVATPTANDVKGILFDTVYCYSNKKFSFYNGTAYYFLESGCFDIEWRNCISINAFSGDIEARDSSNLVVNAHTSIAEGTQPLLWKAKSTKGFPLKSIYVTNSVFMTQSANSANVAMGTSGGAYDGELVHSDYNLFYTSAHNNRIEWHGTNYTSIATWRTQTGQDAHSLFVDPKLVSVPTGSGWDNATTGDYHPNSSTSSPLIAAGLDQSAKFTIDYEGNTRSAPWTIGALPAFAGGGGGGGGGITQTNGIYGSIRFDGGVFYK